jgi:hypothetical protein
VFERLALPERRVELRVAQRTAPFDAQMRNASLDERDLERQRCDRLAETGQCFGLETFNVDLDESGFSVT